MSTIYNEDVSIGELADASQVILVLKPKATEPEKIEIRTKAGKIAILQYFEAEVLEVLKFRQFGKMNRDIQITQKPKKGFHRFESGVRPEVGRIIHITNLDPLNESPPPGKSYAIQYIQNPGKVTESKVLFFSKGYQEDFLAFTSSLQEGLVDIKMKSELIPVLQIREIFDALRENKIESLKEALVKSKAALNAVDATWGTPLQFAARYGNHEQLEFLLKSGASSEVKNQDGNFVIHDLLTSQFFDNFEWVVKNLGHLDSKNEENQTPSSLALKINRPDLVKIIEAELGRGRHK